MNRRLLALDAARGIAAIAVVLLHLGQRNDAEVAGFSHAYAAVDFFFLLSGLVLARAYEPAFRGGMTAGQFMAARFKRLYPLYALGLGIGIAHELLAHKFARLDVALAAIANGVFLPARLAGNDNIFPLNAPAWSLFFELVANLALALVAARLTDRRLLGIIAASFVGLLLIHNQPAAYELGGVNWSTIPGGLARVFFSFFVGVLLARRMSTTRVIRSDAALLVGLAGLLAIFAFAPRDNATDLALIVVVFPALVWAGAHVQPCSRWLRWLSAQSGEVSYPLYATHMPLIGFVVVAVSHFVHGAAEQAAVVVGLLGFAALAGRYWDAPIRAWLNRRARKTAPAFAT